MAAPNSDPGAGAPRLQRSKGSAKLRFGKDKIFRTLSGSEHSAPSYSASSDSLASSDGEELTTWCIETHGGRRSSDDPAVPSVSPAARPAPLQPATHACASLADLEVLATIGTGTFGRVKLARGRSDGQFYALKVLRKEQLLRLKQVQHVLNERRLLAAVDHPNIVEMYGTFQDDAKLYMVMEFVPGGELFGHLRAAGRFTAAAARFYTACVVAALDHLHCHDIIYRDLKPENLLIAPSGYVKLCDFGFAKRLGPGPRARTFTLCGTPEYLAPELVSNEGHGKGVDWWAVGVLLFEMLAGYPPWQDGNSYAVYRAVLAGRLAFPHHFDPDAKDLVRALLSRDAGGRLGCGVGGGAAIKAHPFLSSVDWEALHKGALEPPFMPQLEGLGDRRHFGRYSSVSIDGGAAEMLPALLAGGGNAFREF